MQDESKSKSQLIEELRQLRAEAATSAKLGEEKLRQLELLTDTALDAQVDTFLLFEPATGKAIRWNRAFRETTGYTNDEIFRMPAPGSYYSPEDLERAIIFIQKIMDAEEGSIELELISKNGRKTPTEYHVAVIADDDGNPKYLVSIGRDITEHKQAEEQLKESAERFHQMAENIHDVFWIGSPDWNDILYISPAYENIWGRSCQSLYENPRSWQEAIVGEDREKVEAALIIKTTGTLSDPEFPEYRIVRPDGSVRWIQAQAFPVTNEAGEVYRVVGSARDITERKQAENEVRKAEAFSTGLIDTAQMIILVLNPDATIRFINPYMEALSGYRLDEVVGKDWFEILLPDRDWDQVRALFRKAISGTHTKGNITAIITKDGTERVIEWCDQTLEDGDGKVIGLLATGQDITERKRIEMEQEKLLRDMGERAKELQCIYGVSESIRTRKTMEEIFQDMANLIPPGWHYPEITRGKVVFGEQEYVSEPFTETEWKQSSAIIVNGEPVGSINVYYLEETPELDEGPFIKEERDLIDAMAKTVAQAIKRKQAGQALQERAEKLQRFNKVAIGRELVMIDLKKEINALLAELGRENKYVIHEPDKRKGE